MSEGIEVAKKLPVTDDIREAMATIRRGTDSFLIEEEFEQKLARSKATGKPLRCKLGLDPTAPDIHIGHTVVLNKLRQLQDLGHQVIFLVGDFTAAIGDPSGRNVTRPPLSREQITANAETYLAQAGHVLDLDKTEVRYNSEWSNALGSVGLQACAENKVLDLPLQEIRQFTSVFNAVKDYYVEDVADNKLLQLAVEGMVSGLDPHSNFLDVEGFKDMNESTQGAFGGLGLEVTKDPAGVRVISPIDDTPAARAGVRAGDIITKIDGESVADVTLNDAVKRMRGEPDTKIELTVARKGEMKPLTFHLTRAIIKTQSVKMQKLDGGFGYIRISQFQERTTEDLAKYLNELAEAKSLKGLVLDLRNDPGGLLQAAIGVSAAFLPANTDVVSTKGRAPQSDYVFKAIESDYRSGNAVRALADLTPLAKTVPIVVLINSSSASASEIVAGALQDHKRAVIMGDRSFGKGSVQTILPMTFGDKTVGVKLTTARYYTPSGRSIQAKGIVPDVFVDDTPVGNYPSFQVRESDLSHHLVNENESETEAKKKLDELPYGDEDVVDMPDYTYFFGDEKDWQLQQAVRQLKGEKVEVSKYRGKPRKEVAALKKAEAEKKKAEEAKAAKAGAAKEAKSDENKKEKKDEPQKK